MENSQWIVEKHCQFTPTDHVTCRRDVASQIDADVRTVNDLQTKVMDRDEIIHKRNQMITSLKRKLDEKDNSMECLEKDRFLLTAENQALKQQIKGMRNKM